MERGKKIINYFTVLGFFLILAFPMVNGHMQFIDETEIVENRKLGEKPVFDINTLDNYTEKYNTYYSDHFSTRTHLINFLNENEFNIFGVSSKPGIVRVGSNGWFYATKSKMNYENAYVLDDSKMNIIREELIKRNDWCDERGIKYYTVITPNKMNVYPEFLPRTVFKKGDLSRYDQLLSLNSDPKINIIGTKETLLKHKKDKYKIFQKTDDHWTDYGAFLGYEVIMKRIEKDFPVLKPQQLDEFDISIVEKKGGLAEMISLAEEFPEQMVKLKRKAESVVVNGVKKGYKSDGGVPQYEVEIVKSNANGKPMKCLIIRDSFTLAMMKHFNEHFQSTIYIHDEWRGRIRKDIIEIEKPDIVIVILLETHSTGLITSPSF
jgi:alginate O-acetyltransferase complex protein AlgJ